MSEDSARTVSIVITCYNYEDYVGAAVESALRQTRPADEIIVLDDGSTDNSRAVLSGYGSRITTIFKKNEGVIATVNRGYQESKGDVVVFLDADDALYRTALEEILSVLSPNISKIQYDLDVIDSADNLLGRRFCNFSERDTPERIERIFKSTGTYIWPVTSGNAYPRAFLNKVMPMTPPVSHDGVLNTIAPLYGPVVTIPKPLGRYRLHNRNYSRIGGSAGLPDFGRSILNRRKEFAILREHADRMGVPLPVGNLLDNELTFVAYRLIARKMGYSYEGAADESSGRLAQLGVRLSLTSHDAWRAKLVQSAWFILLLLANRSFAKLLVHLRFNRAAIKDRFRRLIGR